MSKQKKNKSAGFSDEQAIRGTMPNQFDHEFANEPLTENEKRNNKKTKKRK
ncbi:small acid-soluble spore protein O [Paraliobacillus salinarum]|uniref:small acid-soluble spore protein O n=1 Tax=Paraliobacillus salinarum TaxID=1158996 RepID=UPI0015F35E63|nr:small acid-soluble spore protein O [Paraliobacillus salinarum]